VLKWSVKELCAYGGWILGDGKGTFKGSMAVLRYIDGENDDSGKPRHKYDLDKPTRKKSKKQRGSRHRNRREVDSSDSSCSSGTSSSNSREIDSERLSSSESGDMDMGW
jgi:hypothetical protein